MTIDDYIENIKDVLMRMDKMFDGGYIRADDQQTIESIRNQLNFILSFAESRKSFKQGLLERKRYEVKTQFETYPSQDWELRNAIKAVYNDLDFHDYNVGNMSREVSEYYFEFIGSKSSYHKKLMKENSFNDEHAVSSALASYFFNDLFAANYTKGWIRRGIKNLQYFFLVGVFNYKAQVWPTIHDYPHPDALKLTEDIYQISQFYETDEAEGTHMYLNPVALKEIDGKTHLVDLKGNIVAYPQS